VPVINYLHDKPGATFPGDQRAKYDAFLAGSSRRELWGYQSCMSHGCGGTVDFGNPSASDDYFTGWPSYMIDASGVRNRAMQWLAFRYRLAGELYYEVTQAYGHDPWTNQWDFSGNGDGTLFYPGTPAKIGGTTHVPVASIRLKLIREGMEDYEYLKLLSDAGDDALAREIAAGLFPNPYSTEVAPAALMAARERIARRIAELAPTEPEPPADPGSPRDPAAEEAPLLPVVGGGCATDGAAGLLALAGLAGAARLRRRRR
jgi:MYXO-CTERM domain-containing protein